MALTEGEHISLEVPLLSRLEAHLLVSYNNFGRTPVLGNLSCHTDPLPFVVLFRLSKFAPVFTPN